MDDLLDYSPPTNKNFKKAKIFFKIIATAFILIVACTFIVRYLPINRGGRDIILALPSLFFFILTPIALFYMLKSYIHKETPTKRRFLYLLGIIFFNLFFLLCVVLIVRDINQSFFK